jgi:hypothetical protein
LPALPTIALANRAAQRRNGATRKDDMATIKVYDPTAASSVRGSALAPRLTDLRGTVAGILDNRKANAGVLMTAVVEELKRHHGVRDVVLRTKPVAGPASPETVRVLKEQADFVLVGSAD